MAKDKEEQKTTQPKRLARAKIKRPETPEEVAKRKEDRKKTLRNIAVSAFAVILVLSMMVPSLAAIVSGARQAKAVSQAQSGEVTSETIDAVYQAQAEEDEAALAASPNDKDAILAVANDYFGWGYAVGAYATDENAVAHSAELLDKAQGLYDQYLAQEESSDAEVNRALCMLYKGDATGAQEALESVVEKDANCASAWANLGMIYEMSDPDKATAAYESAIAADPDDEAGAKTFAQGRLDAIAAAADASTEGEAEATGEEAQAEAEATDETSN
ncbi:MAG: tetratricopeptide repeat protein [Atopobiaceae bacterium]|nr:tetratricopeptide repeat protein [Atopobiaceae bacterium]